MQLKRKETGQAQALPYYNVRMIDRIQKELHEEAKAIIVIEDNPFTEQNGQLFSHFQPYWLCSSNKAISRFLLQRLPHNDLPVIEDGLQFGLIGAFKGDGAVVADGQCGTAVIKRR